MSNFSKNYAAVMPEADSRLVLIDRPVPSPSVGEVLIQNHAIAVNPFDWKRQARNYKISSFPVVLGSGKYPASGSLTCIDIVYHADISGVVVATGPDVTKFKIGDRVIGWASGFISQNNDHGAFQGYTVVPESVTSKLPDNVSLEEGVVLPTGVASAVVTLFHCLGQKIPLGSNECDNAKEPALLIWGGASTVGTMTIQFARTIGITVYTTASPTHHEYLKSLGASYVFDYRSDTVVEDILNTAKKTGKPILFALDAISEGGTFEPCVEILKRSLGEGRKKLIVTLPQDKEVPGRIDVEFLPAFVLWNEREDLSTWVFHNFLPVALESRFIVPSPKARVIDGGLGSLQAAMDMLQKGVSCEKILVRPLV